MDKKLAFGPHVLRKQQLKPLNDAVIVTDMSFETRFTQSGIIIPNDNGKSSGIRPRWGQVYAVGPDQKDIHVGTWVCVAHGRWTRGIEIEDETGTKTLRRIDPNDVLAQCDTEPQDSTFSDAIHVEKKPDHMLHT